MSANEPDWIVELATWLATYALHGVLWFALAWSLARLLKTPQLREWTWKASVVGALLSASLIGEFGVGQRPLTWSFEKSVARPSAGSVQTGMMTQADGDDAPSVMHSNVPSPAATASGAGQATSGLAWSRIPFASLLVAAWAIASVLWVAALLTSRRRCLRELGEGSAQANSSTQSLFDRVFARSGSRRHVTLRVAEQLASPVALAGGVLCLPNQVVETMSADEQEAVLAHELAHIVRRDPEWQLALALLSRVFFFQPLLRFSARRIETEAEFLCDDRAALWSGKPLALARGLRQVAIWSVQSKRLPAWNGAAMVLPAEAKSSALVSRVERLLSRPEGPSSLRVRVATFVGISGFATAMACVGPAVGSDDRPERIDVVFKVEQSDENPDEWKEIFPESAIRSEDHEQENLPFTVSLLDDGRVSLLFPGPVRVDSGGSTLITMASEVVLRALDAEDIAEVIRISKIEPPTVERAVFLRVAPSTEPREWLRLLEILAAQGHSEISFELEGDRHIPASLASDGSGDSYPLDPSFLEINLSVLKAGEKVDVDSGDTWGGSGRFTFKDRSILYTATSAAKALAESGMSMSQGLAVDSIAGIAQYLASEKSKAPELGARIQAGAGTVYGDVAPLLDALIEAGFVDIVFVEFRP